ncbi:MAG TPA: ABC transporter permease, partial [Rhodoglobus sp.]|nr:ABC transporter permease [Rhodoglobus sp.]
MTTVEPAVMPSSAPVVLEKAVVRNWKPPIAFGIFAIIALVMLIVFGRAGVTTFRLSTDRDLIQLPAISANVTIVSVAVTVLLFLIAIASAYLAYKARKTPLWLTAVFAFLFLVGFLTWAAANATIPIPGLLVGTVGLSVPLIFGALGGVISERVGVVNVAIEGQLLAGAFVSAVVASVTQQPLLGLVSAMVASVLVSFVLAA